MEKNYRDWMPVKSKVNNTASRPLNYREREIWVCSIGENIGFENDGKGKGFRRPVLVLKIYNRYSCLIMPLSTTQKRTKYHYEFDGHTGKMSVALLSQVRTIDSARLHDKIGYADKEDFSAIKTRLIKLLQDTNSPSAKDETVRDEGQQPEGD